MSRSAWLPPALVAGMLLLAGAVGAQPGQRPGIFLEGATVARAKALALDAAMLKGWYVAESGREHTRFETILEEPAAPGPLDDRPPPERTLLRIRADFIATPAGVNTYLQAQEVWWQGEPGEWTTDVTGIYRANLMRALESLQRQWTAFRKQHPGAAPRVAAPRVRVEPGDTPRPLPTTPRPLPTTARPLPITPRQSAAAQDAAPLPGGPATPQPLPTGAAVQPLPQASPPADVPASAGTAESAPVLPAHYEVGVWAYYAEQYAREHGCTPGDLGAVLEGNSGASELHRVYCADGNTRLVRCDREHCQDGG